jgi:apolipoprotein N-acyltransferase
MKFSWQTRFLLALASGVTLALAFPNYNLSLLAWVSVGLLVLASYGARLRVAPLFGFLYALVFYPVCLPWIDVVVQQYGGVPPLIAAGLVLLIALAAGIFWAVFTWGIAFASRKGPLWACALAPCLWVAMEFTISRLPIIGFPWNLIGYAAGQSLALLQLTAITGIYGLSFVVAGFGSLIAYAVLVGRQRAWQTVIAAASLLIVIGWGGSYFVPQPDRARFVAHLVQTNFPQSYTYPPNWMETHAGDLQELAQISVDSAKRLPGIIVWPETPAPFSLQDSTFAADAEKIAEDSGQDFVVGVEDWKMNVPHPYATNSAVLLGPNGQRLFTYDKIHLVPFGEYVPLRKWLTFAGKLTADIGDFTPGSRYSVGSLPGGKFGAFICYEATFPNLVRHFSRNGAELLINMSNDGWFGRSAAPAQHLMMARVRAVENRRWLLRDTNNGFTVDVDPYGRVVVSLATDIRGELDAPYDFRSDITPYVRFGDWFAWLCVIASIAMLTCSEITRLRTR